VEYYCALCFKKIDLSDGLPDPDIEIIDDRPTHGACVIHFYNAHKGEVNLSDFEKKVLRRSEE
jgi:hypothetical protein